MPAQAGIQNVYFWASVFTETSEHAAEFLSGKAFYAALFTCSRAKPAVEA